MTSKSTRSNPDIVYAASYARGVWRSSDSGTTWTQIKPSLNATIGTTRPDIAVTTLPNGQTRMYVGEGHTSAAEFSRLYRSDDVESASPVFTQINEQRPGERRLRLVQLLHRPVLVRQLRRITGRISGHRLSRWLVSVRRERAKLSNGRGVVLLSTDGGMSFNDMTMDGTDPVHPNGLHPDQHDPWS